MTAQLQFEKSNSNEYEVVTIWDNAIYARKSKGQLSGLQYLILLKGYLEKENTWEPVLAVQHFQKLINTFYKDHLDKPIVTLPPVNYTPSMARLNKPIKTLNTKQKCD